MQPPSDDVRGATADEVVALIRDADGVSCTGGCELLTGLDLLVAEDITAGTVSGSVSRSSYARLHGTAQLVFDRALPWASALVRPYMVMTDGVVSARFNLGVYYTASPEEMPGVKPVQFGVTCYDVLTVLDDPVGDSYWVAEGTSYLAAVEEILLSRGVVRYVIDQAAAGLVLGDDMTWPPSDQLTWLTIVNALLSAIGYQGIWSDWNGWMHCQAYLSPRERAPEWVYDVDPDTSLIATRNKVRDFYATPNVWVFTRQNNTDGPQPVEGDGRYTVVNQSDGDTSIDARGRTITRPVQVDAADQASLVATATRMVDADKSIPAKVTLETFPNPLHWHFDVVYVTDPGLGPPTNAVTTSWSLPLNGGNMRHEWTLLNTLGAE